MLVPSWRVYNASRLNRINQVSESEKPRIPHDDQSNLPRATRYFTYVSISTCVVILTWELTELITQTELRYTDVTDLPGNDHFYPDFGPVLICIRFSSRRVIGSEPSYWYVYTSSFIPIRLLF